MHIYRQTTDKATVKTRASWTGLRRRTTAAGGPVLTTRVEQRQRFRQREGLKERSAVGGTVECSIYRTQWTHAAHTSTTHGPTITTDSRAVDSLKCVITLITGEVWINQDE